MQQRTTTIIKAKYFENDSKTIKLVVVMIAVNLWKAQKLQSVN